MASFYLQVLLFFFNDTATTEIYTLSLHDALPIYGWIHALVFGEDLHLIHNQRSGDRSEEHTSELQSPDHLVCRLLLEKKKKNGTVRSCGGCRHTPVEPLEVEIARIDEHSETLPKH